MLINDADTLNSAFHGVNVALTNISGLNSVAVTSTGPGPSTVQNSVATGIQVALNGTVTGTPNITVDGYNVSNSTSGSGIGVFNNGKRRRRRHHFQQQRRQLAGGRRHPGPTSREALVRSW